MFIVVQADDDKEQLGGDPSTLFGYTLKCVPRTRCSGYFLATVTIEYKKCERTINGMLQSRGENYKISYWRSWAGKEL